MKSGNTLNFYIFTDMQRDDTIFAYSRFVYICLFEMHAIITG